MSEVGETEQTGDYRGLRSKSRLRATSKQVAQSRIPGLGKQSEEGGRWHPRVVISHNVLRGPQFMPLYYVICCIIFCSYTAGHIDDIK